MGIYSCVFIIVALLALLECILNKFDKIKLGDKVIVNKNSQTIQHFVFAMAMIILFIISAIRDQSVGTDMARYIPRYRIISETGWQDLVNLPESWGFEKGFILFCKIISYISLGNEQVFTIVTSLIIAIGMYIFIKEFSVTPFLSLVVYVGYGYWTNSFNTVRQYMAISILCIALKLWKDNKKLWTIILTIIAVSIHTSSVVFVAIYFVSNLKFTTKSFCVSIVLACAFYIMPIEIIDKLLSYTSYGWYVTREGSGESILIVIAIIYCVAFAYRKNIDVFDKHGNMWFWMLFFSIISNVLALKIGLFERIMRIFLIALMPLTADIVYCFRNKPYRIIVYITVILAWGLYFYLVLLATPESSGNTIPYITYFMN